MQQKLEKERQHFEAAKRNILSKKRMKDMKKTKKQTRSRREGFKQKEQEIKLNERQHKEQLEQRKQIANNEARMKQREFDEKESEKHEKMKHDYMSMSFAIGIWIFCILLSIRFKNKLLEKFSVKQHWIHVGGIILMFCHFGFQPNISKWDVVSRIFCFTVLRPCCRCNATANLLDVHLVW